MCVLDGLLTSARSRSNGDQPKGWGARRNEAERDREGNRGTRRETRILPKLPNTTEANPPQYSQESTVHPRIEGRSVIVHDIEALNHRLVRYVSIAVQVEVGGFQQQPLRIRLANVASDG